MGRSWPWMDFSSSRFGISERRISSIRIIQKNELPDPEISELVICLLPLDIAIEYLWMKAFLFKMFTLELIWSTVAEASTCGRRSFQLGIKDEPFWSDVGCYRTELYRISSVWLIQGLRMPLTSLAWQARKLLLLNWWEYKTDKRKQRRC